MSEQVFIPVEPPVELPISQRAPPEIGRYVFLGPDDGSKARDVGIVLYLRPNHNGSEEPMTFRMPFEIAEELMVHILDFLKRHGHR